MAFLALVPKKKAVVDLKDFRPFSLERSFFKWLTKVLANRLKKVMGELGSCSQKISVKGGHILDAILIEKRQLILS